MNRKKAGAAESSRLTGWEDTNYGEKVEGVPVAGAVHLQSTAKVPLSNVPNP